MKILGLIVSGVLGAMAMTPVTAAPGDRAMQPAATHVSTRHVVVRQHTVTRTGPGWQSNRWAKRRVCENRWRDGRRIRVCRTVRYRR